MNIVIMDFETTGLLQPSSVPLAQQPHIIEVGALRIDDGKEAIEMSQLVKPPIKLEPIITKITGIKDEDLADKPPFGEVVGLLADLMRGAELLVAHNASFDVGCLKVELQRLGIEDFPWPEKTVCTVEEFYHVRGRRLKLTELYAHFVNKPLEQTHRALDDVRALREALNAAGWF